MATQKKFVVKNGLIASDLSYPTSDGTANQTIVTDGAGNLSFGTAGTAETLTFTGKNTTGSTIAKGTVVYVSDLSGNTPEISLARANSSSTMPAFGLVTADIGNNNNGAIDTFGSLRGLNVANFGETGITFALGDTLYVSASEAGKLTNVPPAGEANLIQNIGKIERAAPTTNMTIKVGGAGRTNATSALNDGNIFIGNSSNQSSTAALNTSIVPEGSNLYYTDARADARAALIVDAAPSTLDTLNELAAALGDDANFSTTVTNSIANKLPLAGGTITGDVSFTNGNKAVFGGTGNGELEIYAHATNNNVYISENAAGNLNLGADNFNIYTNAFTKQVASFTAGSAKLLNDGNEKLATTSIGIDVTGTVRADDLTIGHTSNFSNALANDVQVGTVTGSHGISILSQNNSYSSLFFADNDNNDAGSIRYNHSNNTIDVYTDRAQRLAINSTGIDVTGNITVSGYIAGPAVLTIDPAGVGDNTGKVVIAGDLQIDGTTTTINSTTLTVDDLNITLASGAADSAAANGAGITVDGANATITYDGTNDEWDFNKDVNVTGNIALSGTVDGVDIAARDGVLTSTTTTANAALPKAGGAITGAITTNSTFDGRNVSVDGDKLDLIEAGATADQTAAQLLTAIKTVDGTGSGLDADLLDGQQGSYYYSSGNPPPLTADPTLTLTGDATGSATFTNLGNATLTVAIADDSHNHTLANIDQVTINNTNDLDTYNTRGLYNWSSSNPANSPYAYGSMLVLPDGSQSQQLLQTYGGTANTVSLYGRRKTSGTWDTTWTQYFSDHYHPNADTLTTARNINGVAFDGSIDITVADATKLPLAGGTLTGGLTINENGDSLHLRNTTNGGSVGVSFSSNVPASQIGHLRFSHSDTVTYGSGAAFVLGSTEATTTILADGKLMFDEGIYSKPATGTGAGTRKDANWDTAYTTANTANTTANAALPKAGGTMTGPLTIDTDNNANGGLRLLVNQTNPEQDFYFAQEIVSTLSGATVTTADREQGGIWIDLNSTATGGGTNHEHRVYGAYLDVDSTGDADMVYGVFADATVTPSTGQTSQVTGGYFKAEDNGGAGAVSSVFGVQGLAQSDNATSDTNTLIGGYFKTTNIADTGNVTTASAVYGEIEIAAGTGDHYGTSHVFQAQYDNNDTVAQTNTTYLYYGNYAGVLPTTAYGVYIADAVTSYFGGTIRSAGDVVAYYSDERLKDFHGTIPNAMDKVKQLNGYYFTENQLAKDLGYNNDSTQVGVSAQEVEAVLPEIVKEAAINTEKGTDYKTVQYEKLTALLIEAVKEQQTEIDELKKLVKDLMSR